MQIYLKKKKPNNNVHYISKLCYSDEMLIIWGVSRTLLTIPFLRMRTSLEKKITVKSRHRTRSSGCFYYNWVFFPLVLSTLEEKLKSPWAMYLVEEHPRSFNVTWLKSSFRKQSLPQKETMCSVLVATTATVAFVAFSSWKYAYGRRRTLIRTSAESSTPVNCHLHMTTRR